MSISNNFSTAEEHLKHKRFAVAIPLYEKVAQYYLAKSDYPNYLYASNKLAESHGSTMQIGTFMAITQKTYTLVEQHLTLATHASIIAETYSHYAGVFFYQQQIDKAISYFEQSIAIIRQYQLNKDL